MSEQVQNEANHTPLNPQRFYSNVTDGFVITQGGPDESHPVARPDVMQLDRSERLKLAINDLRIGQRIHEELKRQGRTVSWLARQLGMERTSLYHTFRQNSIDTEYLLRISYLLGHNFLQDEADVFKAYGL